MGAPVCHHSWDTGVPSSRVGGQTAPASRLRAAPRPGRSRGRYRAPAGAAASRREISTATLCCSRYSEPLLIAPGPDLISVSEPLPDSGHQVASGPISDSMDGSSRYRCRHPASSLFGPSRHCGLGLMNGPRFRYRQVLFDLSVRIRQREILICRRRAAPFEFEAS